MLALERKNARREFLRAHRSRVGVVRAAKPEGTRAKRLSLRNGMSSCRDGRFLNVDPIIGNPANSQTINPYSYVLNNPLAGKDPNGYQCVAETGSHICGVNTGAENGQTTYDAKLTKTDPSTGDKTTTSVSVGVSNGKIVSIGAAGPAVISGAAAQGTKGPGGQSAQNVDSATDAGNANASGKGVQQESQDRVFGKAQKSSKTPTHDTTSERIRDEALEDPNTERVHLNQSLRTVTGDPNAPNQRPDVSVVKKDGSIDMHEVTSAGQTNESQELKLRGLRPQLGRPGSNYVVEPDPIIRGVGLFGVLLMVFHEYVNYEEAHKYDGVPCAKNPNCM